MCSLTIPSTETCPVTRRELGPVSHTPSARLTELSHEKVVEPVAEVAVPQRPEEVVDWRLLLPIVFQRTPLHRQRACVPAVTPERAREPGHKDHRRGGKPALRRRPTRIPPPHRRQPPPCSHQEAHAPALCKRSSTPWSHASTPPACPPGAPRTLWHMRGGRAVRDQGPRPGQRPALHAPPGRPQAARGQPGTEASPSPRPRSPRTPPLLPAPDPPIPQNPNT